MSNQAHYNNYSAEDIQNYLTGKLTPLQMNAMEKAALDDPFLAEAMEGYALMQTDEWKKALAAAKLSLPVPQTGAKIIPLTKRKNNWWKAAAAVLVIGLTGTLGYIFFTKEKTSEPEIAQNIPTQKDKGDVVPLPEDSTHRATAVADNNTEIAALNTPSKDNRTIVKDITRAPAEAIAESAFVYTPSKIQPQAPGKTDADYKQAADDVAVGTKPATQAPAAAAAAGNGQNTINAGEGYSKNSNAEYESFKKEKKAETSIAAARQEIKLNKTFFAQVVGADNSPLPFANVNIKSENFGTYADVKGNFRLLSNDSVLTVEVRSAGFKPQLVTLRSNVQQNRVILSEDNSAFTERTVISSNTAKNKVSRRTLLVTDSVYNVEPADGWDNYNTYVDNNIEIPDDILKNNIHGQVELSFDVKSNGAITNIKVDKSLCNNCDEAAVRMLQQGPQWKVKKGKKGKGKITVQF